MTTEAVVRDHSDSDAAPAATTVTFSRAASIVLAAAGLLGLASAATLTIERFELLVNPSYVPSCNLNPVISCGSVMTTPQASVLGFPNSIVGIAAFTVVVVTAVLSLARTPLPRWYPAGLLAGLTVGVGFVHWLMFQSVYRIGALCPYCMVVWGSTMVLWLLVMPTAAEALGATRVADAVRRWRWSALAVWLTVVLLIVAERFWDYWSTLI